MARYRATEKGKEATARSKATGKRKRAGRDRARTDAGLCGFGCGRAVTARRKACDECSAARGVKAKDVWTRRKRAAGLCVEPWCRRKACRNRTRCGPCYAQHAPADREDAMRAIGGLLCARCGVTDNLRIANVRCASRVRGQEALARAVLQDMAGGRDPRSWAWVLCVWCDLRSACDPPAR